MTAPYYTDDTITLHNGDSIDVLRTLASGSVDCCVTSPPYYGLRDYGHPGQIGAEKTPAEYVQRMVELFSEVRRVLAHDGTIWLNLGDSYVGSGKPGGLSRSDKFAGKRSQHTMSAGTITVKPGIPKNLLGVPWRVAFALQDDGWILRNAIVWQKPNAMPESVTDRLSNRYELIFLFSKNRSYWFDLDPIREAQSQATVDRLKSGPVGVRRITPGEVRTPNAVTTLDNGRNPGDVWTIATTPFRGSHFAVFPPELPRRCIVAGCKPGGTVLDPFHGSGTTGKVAVENGRRYVGIELNREYLDLSLRTRLANGAFDFDGEPA